MKKEHQTYNNQNIMDDKESAIIRWKTILKSQAKYILNDSVETQGCKLEQMKIIKKFMTELEKMEKEDKNQEHERS